MDRLTDSAADTYRALRKDYGLHNRPIPQVIGKIVKKFKEIGGVRNIERSVHHGFTRSAENNVIVSKSVDKDPNAEC